MAWTLTKCIEMETRLLSCCLLVYVLCEGLRRQMWSWKDPFRLHDCRKQFFVLGYVMFSQRHDSCF